MQTLSQRSNCHEQKQHGQPGGAGINAKANPIRTIGSFLVSLLSSVFNQRPDYSHSLNHLSEHQLRDIGFTRESADMKMPDVNIGLIHCGLHEQRRSQIRRLPKS